MIIEDLLDAIKIGNQCKIESFIRLQPDLLTSKDFRLGLTPLFHAVLLQDPQSVTTLLNLGSDINQKTDSGQTPLHISSDNSCLPITRTLLSFSPDLNIPNFQGQTALHNAIYRGDYQIAYLLLQSGADPNFQSTKSQKTPLHLALQGGFTNCIRILRYFGASINTKDVQQKTPRMLAKSLGLQERLNQPLIELNGLLINTSLVTIPEARPSDQQRWTLASPHIALSSKGFRCSSCSFPDTPQVFVTPKRNLTTEEPDAELSLKRSIFSLKNFLADLSLEKYISLFMQNSLESLQQLLTVQKSADYLTIPQLKRMGIQKIGECGAILVKLDQLAGVSEPIKVEFPMQYEKKERCQTLKCCSVTVASYVTGSEVENWLLKMNLEQLADQFLSAGYSKIDLVYQQYISRHGFNDQLLQQIGIEEQRYRVIILNRLRTECRAFRQSEIQLDSSSQCISCNCNLM